MAIANITAFWDATLGGLVDNIPTFQRNLLPPTSRQKNKE
jgi:hypothetical protein